MIPYEADPSLHAAQPAPVRLDDGFSPPSQPQPPAAPSPAVPEPSPVGLDLPEGD